MSSNFKITTRRIAKFLNITVEANDSVIDLGLHDTTEAKAAMLKERERKP